MPDTEWVDNIRKIAMQAVNAGDPCDVLAGTVESLSPLSVRIDQKTAFKGAQLILPKHLTDHPVRMVLPEYGETEVMVRDGLQAGEQVLLIQKRGGQQFVMIGRL